MRNKNTQFKKLKLPLLLTLISFSGVFFFQYLTFIPSYSSATDPISTPIYNGPTTDTRTLSDITYMQEMTSGICNRSKMDVNKNIYESKRLIDKRDGKHYWVTKLSDGKCWMTQNLDLDLGIKTDTVDTTVLTPVDSDVSSNWTVNANERTIKSVNTQFTASIWPATDFIIRSYDPGEYVSITPTTRNPCNETNNFSNCINGRWRLIDDSWNASTIADYGESVDDDAKVYNAHYLIGNFYSWDAAVAGSAVNYTGSTKWFEQSICPKNWQILNINEAESMLTDKGNAIAKFPYYFLMAGGLYPPTFTLVGAEGDYWSSAGDKKGAHFLTTYSEYAGGDYTSRYVGFSVRCTARTDVPDAPIEPDIDNPNISVKVPEIITLDVYSSDENNKTVNITTDNSGRGFGRFKAKVSSNSSYNLSLSTIDDGHTDLRNDKTNTSIPTLSPSVTTDDKSWWGIKCANSPDCTKTGYTGLTNSTIPYFSSTTGGSDLITNFTIGIQTSPDLPSGTYSTSILVTASPN